MVPVSRGQVPDLIQQQVDTARLHTLANHRPLWANAANDAGQVSANQVMQPMTLVLARSAQQEQALEQLIAEQQNPASPEYHHWLTPEEFGERFGLSDNDLSAITSWLQSQGLHVDGVSPSRIFIRFSGVAANANQAFGTELHYYTVDGEQRYSVSNNPTIPQSLAFAIQAVRGLSTPDERPTHHRTAAQSYSPLMTIADGNFIAPADFNKIYDVPTSLTGAGETIGIVSESRTDFADFTNFSAQTGVSFSNPTEVIPTAYGGVDPGAAFTTTQSPSTQLDLQSEATLDVQRAGSVAPGANLLLVVASAASGGIADDAQYLVETSPAPAQIMSISFGSCESSAGASGVSFWDTLFQQATAEGISVFVSSGDSGASGCDTASATPPASPAANSINALCASSYATCVGGTEFNDASDPSEYWSSSNGFGLLSALSYIPEGAWNEPGTNGATEVDSSGGGVSTYIATPAWQVGTGVPSARSGRYTPDVSFSSSCHDGYFGCLAADGASCVAGGNGSYAFVGFCGTSAVAPGMAGVAALLNQKLGSAQGNLNQQLYLTATADPAAFHDVTVATSGVSSCSASTPSMCNNSIPGPSTLTGGQAGYLVTTGYDEVTGLGSLDVQTFLDDYGTMLTPTVTVSPSPTSFTTAQSTTVTITVSGGSGYATPTGSITLSSGSYTSTATTLSNGSASITVPAGSLAAGADTLSAAYAPDSNSSSIYHAATGTHSVTVSVAKTAPIVTVSPSASQITTAQSLTVTVTVSPTTGNPTPTGSVVLSSGSYTSASTTLSNGSASITIAAGSLATAVDTLTAAYTPDSNSSSSYNSASGTGSVTVTAKVTPTVTVSPSPASITTTQVTVVTISVAPSSGYGTPTGSIILSSGSYSSASTSLSNGSASISIPAGTLPTGTDSLIANYTPDSNSSPIYYTASGTHSLTVSSGKMTPTVAVSPSASQITTAQALSVSVSVTPTSGNPTPTGSVVLSTGSYTSAATTLSGGSASITIPAGSLSPGTATLSATYTPDSNSSSNYNSASGSGSVTVTSKVTPGITVSPSPTSITTTQVTVVSISVAAGNGYGTPTGSVALSSGSYTSAATTLASGSASISIPAGSLATGTDTLTAAYTPDSTSSLIYNSTSGTNLVTVSAGKITPTVTVSPSASKITSSQSLAVTIAVASTSGNPTPTGSVVLSSGSYTSSAATLSGGSAVITIPAGSLPNGKDTLSASYTPDSNSSSAYNSASGTNTVNVTGKVTPTVTVSPTSASITIGQTATISLTVADETGSGFGTPTGSVTLSSGSYTSAATAFDSGSTSITIPAGSLATGADTLTATYTPDSASSPIYNSTSGTASVTVTAKTTPTVTVSPSPATINAAQTTTVTITLAGSPTPTGSVVLTSLGYTSPSGTLLNGSASITIPAGSLAGGTDTLTATYAPDSTSSPLYTSATGTASIAVTAEATPTVTVSPSSSIITTTEADVVTVTLTGSPTPTGSVILSSQGYASAAVTLSNGAASIVVPSGSLSVGVDTLAATYTPDLASSPLYNSASGSALVTVAVPTVTTTPSFTVAATNVSLSAGATTGNTSTITVTPQGGFTGLVQLTATITSSPSGATNLPTFSFGSSGTLGLSGTAQASTTMSISTTASSTTQCVKTLTASNQFPWRTGGAALACLLLFGIPARRRRAMLGAIALCAVLASGLSACTASPTVGCTDSTTSGTTAGTYTITVTATSSSTASTANNIITLTVQ